MQKTVLITAVQHIKKGASKPLHQRGKIVLEEINLLRQDDGFRKPLPGLVWLVFLPGGQSVFQNGR